MMVDLHAICEWGAPLSLLRTWREEKMRKEAGCLVDFIQVIIGKVQKQGTRLPETAIL
jgi:hypothetical protein